MSVCLEVSLFGTCAVCLQDRPPREIRGAKHRALIAILATAPLGRRTRTYLQNTLWGYAGYDSGHQNLRRALSDLRKLFGDHFDTLFRTTNTDIELDLAHVRFTGDPGQGLFLEDLNVREAPFQEWVDSIRANPDQIFALYRHAPVSSMRRPRPCVTMLPLRQMGNDPGLAALGDWISEHCCRILSRSRFINVISHLSGRAAGAAGTPITTLSETLGVDYLTTGFLRPSRQGFICDVDFIEAASGQIIWSRSFEARSFADLTETALEIDNIARGVARSIADSAIETVRSQRIDEISDHNLIVAGVSMMHRATMRDFLKSREYLLEASERLSHSADAHAWLGKWYVLNVMKGYSIDLAHDTQRAIDCTARALDTDPEASLGLTIDGFANNNLLNDFETAEKRFDAALDINPNESLAWLLRGSLKAFKDEGEEAVRSSEHARRLSPIDPFLYYYDSLASTAYIAADQFEEALKHAEQSLAVNNRHLSTHRARITALHFLDRPEEAKSAAQELLRYWPEYDLSKYRSNHPVSQHKLGQRALTAMSAAGIS